MDVQIQNTDLSCKALLEQRQALGLKIAEARAKEMRWCIGTSSQDHCGL